MAAIPRLRQLPLGLTLVFLLCAPRALADGAWFTRVWQSDEGLPNQHVTALAQSKDGYVWVATMSGLARFDGAHFTDVSFRRFDAGHYLGPGVGGVIPLSDGGVLISRLRGPVVRVSADGGTLSLVDTGVPAGVMPLAATEDVHGGLWIGYAGGILVRVENGKAVRFGAKDGIPVEGTIYSLACDKEGLVWLAKGAAVVVFRDGKFHALEQLGNVPINDKLRLTVAHKGGVWIINREGTLLHATAEGQLEYFGMALQHFPKATALTVTEDHTGAVWIGTDLAGLFRFSNSNFERVPTSLPGITSILETSDGAIWCGTPGGGLNQLSPRRVLFETPGTGDALGGATSITQDNAGSIWAVTRDGQVVVRGGQGWHQAFPESIGMAECITASVTGGVWIGTREGRLFSWHDGELAPVVDPALQGTNITCLLAATNGDVWVARPYGRFHLQRLHAGEWREIPLEAGMDRIMAMTEASDGTVWIATRTGHLLQANGDQLVDATPPTSAKEWPIRALAAAADDELWIGYGGIGVGRLKAGKFSVLGSDRGLPDDYVSQIVADGKGWMWFGCDHGVFKVRSIELERAMAGQIDRVRPVVFGPSEGLRNLEANHGFVPGAVRSRDGNIWIPMLTGIAMAEPQAANEPVVTPSVYLTGVAVDGRAMAAYDPGVLPTPVANLRGWRGPLTLMPEDNRLTFDFAALNFSAPDNVQYRYRLDGVDKDWIDVGRDGRATYSHLGAGDYRFRVQACVADGPWSTAAADFPVRVVPHFWQTTWFLMIVVIVFTGGAALLARNISRRRYLQRIRLLEQQTALEKERARIGRDLHDDLGGALTQVALTLDMAGRESSNGARDRLGQCSAMVRQVAKSVDEIIWAINPRNDTVPYLVDYLSQFVVEFLHAANIRCRVDLPDRLPDRKVTPEARHHLFLAVKESLNNIARHAKATQVSLRVTADESNLAVVIEDDGCGFEAVPDNATSDGLRNMRDRMAEIGGRFELATKRGAGTRVSLVCRWDESS